MTKPEAQEAERVREIVAAHQALEGPLLPILHAVQAEFGHVPKSVLPVIAEALNLTRAEMYGVMTFYHDFREAPAGRHVLKLCRAEACQAQGGDALAAWAKEKLGADWHETKGGVTLEPVFCLGLCAMGPAAMFDETLIARMDEARLGEILGEAGV
jgi:formate dehydrogenase subunit gamma